MKVLVVQSCEPERVRDALAVVRDRWPGGSLGLLREAGTPVPDPRAEVAGTFVYRRGPGNSPQLARETVESVRRVGFDACVIPFNDRFGVTFWAFRRLPMRAGIRRILTVNRDGTVRAYGPAAWAVTTVLACTILRAGEARVPKPVLDRLARWRLLVTDYVMLAALAALALGAALLKRVGLHPLRRRHPDSTVPRLLIFTPTLGLGGAQKVLVNLLRHVDLEKYRVEVCTMPAPGMFFESEVRKLPVALTLLPLTDGPPYWRLIWALVRRLVDTAPDAAIGWLPWATVFTAVAGTIAGVPRVLTSLHSLSPAHYPDILLPWHRPYDLLTSVVADRIVACSDACRADHRRWAKTRPGKIVTIYNGLDAQELVPPTEAENRVTRARLRCEGLPLVGIVGRLSPEKDHRTFFEALRLVRQAVPGVVGLVMGEGREEARLAEEVRRLDLEAHVRFLGARRDVLSIVAALDLLALTSTIEGFPITLLEAQALGVPVVTTAAGGAPEAVRDGETGFVVPCRDARAIADRIVMLLRDGMLRQRLGAAGRAFVSNAFGADRMAASFLQLCEI